MQQLVTVDFRGDTLFAVEKPDGVFVAVKPICRRLGVDWSSQHKRFHRDPLLAEGMVMMTIPSPGGPQEMACLALRLVNGWLFGIDVERVKPELREHVLAYKRECYEVLADRFLGPRVAERPIQVGEPVQDTEYRRRLDTVSEARRLYGAARARLLYENLELPKVPELPIAEIDTTHPLIGAAVDFAIERGRWIGTAAKLLDALNAKAPREVKHGERWPTTPRQLSNTPEAGRDDFAECGVALTRRRSNGVRTITLEAPGACSAP